ncbi:MAG: thioredoxin [Acidobacteriota bacterium]|nr:thioredoxin [Acidobacteriota bacterium]
MSTSIGLFRVTSDNFDDLVLGSDLPVLVDFYADWCGPCSALAPTLEDLRRDLEGRVRIAKVDVDAEPELARRFGVQSIPALIRFRDGQQVDRLVGVLPRAVIEKRLLEVAEAA